MERQRTYEGALSSLGRNRLNQKKFVEAEEPLSECLELRSKSDPAGWRRFNVESLLGGSLLGQGRFDEAEPYLISGYQGMKAREAEIDAQFVGLLADAGARLVELYERWDKPAEAARWRDAVR